MWTFPAFGAAALALFIERLVGYPSHVFDRIGHPVIWIGKLISWLDAHLNRGSPSPAEGRLRGIIALIVIIAAALLPAWFISHLLGAWRNGWAIEALLATSLIAQKSMRDHVLAVYRGLST